MRICSFLPSGTEILFALGLGDEIVGVSHECDYPPAALQKSRVIRPTLDVERLDSHGIDAAVRGALARRESLYAVDPEALSRAQPDLIVTQALCEVCAIGSPEVTEAARLLPSRPRIVSLHPHTLRELWEEIRLLGHVTNHNAQAGQLVSSCVGRLERVQALLQDVLRPRVFCLEWLAPPMASGHWVPEMVELAAGVEVLGRAGAASRYVTPEEIIAARPEVLVVMPCGFSVERTRRELPAVTAEPWWDAIPAVRQGCVFLVDGPAYFNRSGPRLVDGVELLAGLLHPDRCASLIPEGAVERWAPDPSRRPL